MSGAAPLRTNEKSPSRISSRAGCASPVATRSRAVPSIAIGAALSPVIGAMLHSHAMKLLLTSAGIKNPSINDALVQLLGKPIAESSALAIPTASYAQPMHGPERAWAFIAGQEPETPMIELGWKSMG